MLQVTALMLHKTMLSILWHGLNEVNPHLVKPTLLLHDGENEVDTVASALGDVLIYQSPDKQSSINSVVPKSTVIWAKTPDAIFEGLRSWNLWKPRNPILVIQENTSGVKHWISTLWNSTRASNVVVMVLNDPPEYYTWFPYQREECNEVKTLVKVNHEELFQHQISHNLNNCPLRILHPDYESPPLVIDKKTGLEPQLLHNLAKALNFRPIIDVQASFYELTNGSEPANGLKKLWENSVDLMYGNLGIFFILEMYGETLISHTQDSLSLFVPGPKPIATTTLLRKALPPIAWILILSTAFAIRLTVFYLPVIFKTRHRLNFLQTFAIILNMPVKPPHWLPLKILALIVYFFSLHITTAYQAALIISLTDEPHEKPMKTWQDFIDSPYKLIVNTYQKNDIAMPDHPLPQELKNSKRVVISHQYPLEKVRNNKIAMLAPQIMFSFRIRKRRYFHKSGQARVLLLKPPVVPYGICFLMGKGHPLVPGMNEITQWLVEAGIPQHYLELLKNPLYEGTRVVKPFSVKSLTAAFALHITFNTFAVFFFLGELLIYLFHKFRKSRFRN